MVPFVPILVNPASAFGGSGEVRQSTSEFIKGDSLSDRLRASTKRPSQKGGSTSSPRTKYSHPLILTLSKDPARSFEKVSELPEVADGMISTYPIIHSPNRSVGV